MRCPPALPRLRLAALLLLGGGGGPAQACTTVIVGKKASVDGSIYVARTDDTMVCCMGLQNWGAACRWRGGSRR